jgi:hypothetical protein
MVAMESHLVLWKSVVALEMYDCYRKSIVAMADIVYNVKTLQKSHIRKMSPVRGSF